MTLEDLHLLLRAFKGKPECRFQVLIPKNMFLGLRGFLGLGVGRVWVDRVCLQTAPEDYNVTEAMLAFTGG